MTKITKDDLVEVEIQRLQAERDALDQGNLELYRRLIEPDFWR